MVGRVIVPPCSQFCTERTVAPHFSANSSCVRPSDLRKSENTKGSFIMAQILKVLKNYIYFAETLA